MTSEGEDLRVRVARCLQTTFDREHDGENGEWAKMADAVLVLLAAGGPNLLRHDADDLVVLTDEDMAEARRRGVALFGPRVPESMTPELLNAIADNYEAIAVVLSDDRLGVTETSELAALRGWAREIGTP